MSVESEILLDGKVAVSGYCLMSVESGILLILYLLQMDV